MKQSSKLAYVLPYLPSRIRSSVTAMSDYEQSNIQEIRLRLGRKLTVTLSSKEYYLSKSGKLSEDPINGLDVTADDINIVYKLALRDSVHSFQREITRGYVTINGGCRVGFCGTAVLDGSNGYKIENIKDISSVNIRIAREIYGCSDEIYQKVFSNGVCSLLIVGPPSSGKTTVLRDITRRIGNVQSVCLIDERCEIASVSNAAAHNDVGMKTDIFSSYNKFEGIMTAVRVMSPKVLVCDEIGSKEDLKALCYAINSGVKIIASCHSTDINEAIIKPVISKLIKMKAFDAAALLGCGAQCGRLVEYCKL